MRDGSSRRFAAPRCGTDRGEEFVVVDLAEPVHRAHRDFDLVRTAIAAPADHAVTASVGVASVDVASFAAPGLGVAQLLDAMIERADQAMFDAKRQGGNATVHIR